MRPVLTAADQLWHEAGEELVVTAGLDGTHSAGSLHYYGYAVDLRTRYFDRPTIDDIADEMRLALGHNYDVIVHGSHMHVEYDPKGI